MRVVLTPQTFDPLGVVALDCPATQTFGEARRRMSRTATLDGSAAFTDFGLCEADRTITLAWPAKVPAREAAVLRLATLYATLCVATPAGLFLAAVEAYAPGVAESTLRLLVVRRLA